MERLEQLKQPKEVDEAEEFSKHVAARLRTFNARQYAMACLQIEKVLVDTQFSPNHAQPRASHSTSETHQYPSDYYNF